jgi:hypothetical protein
MTTRDSGSPQITELIEFLKSKGLSGDDIADVVMMVNGGVDPKDPAMDEPPYRGRDVPRTGGAKAQDARLRKLVTDGMSRQRRDVQRAHDEHRDGLGLRPIRNLG